MLEVRGLNVFYGKSHVVFDLDLQVGRNEVLALLGRNGAGKTTTLTGVVGLLPGARGQVGVDGRQVSGWPAHRRARWHYTSRPCRRRRWPAPNQNSRCLRPGWHRRW